MKVLSRQLGGRVRRSRHQGVALVLTLLVIAMLVVVVVGFTAVSRLEQVASRNFTYQAAAQQLAQLATDRAVEQLRSAVAAGVESGMYATQSGLLHPQSQDAIPLFSEGGSLFNINALTQSGFVTGSLQDEILVSMQNVTGSGGNIIGQAAFYVYDESVRIPVNYAGPVREALNPTPARPFSIAGVDSLLPNAAVNAFSQIIAAGADKNSISNWSYFFTPDQLAIAVSGIGPVRSRRVSVATETNPSLAQRTPWGTQKISINQLPLADESVDIVVSELIDATLTEVFGGHFGDKYGAEGVVQLAANMLQLRSDYWAGGVNFGGTNAVIGTGEIAGPVVAPPESGLFKKTNGIPSAMMGYVPFPMLSEIGISFVYGWEQTNRLTVRVIVECELFNPYPVAYPGGGQIFAQIDKARFLTTYTDPPGVVWRGPNGTSQGEAPHNDMFFGPGQDAWGSEASGPSWWGPPGADTVLNPALGYTSAPISRIAPGAYAVESFTFDVTFTDTNTTVSVDDIYVIIDQIKLLAEAGNASSIRDWCSGNDFFNAVAQAASGPAQFNLPSGPANGPLGSPSNPISLPDQPTGPVVSLVKMDPRLRPALNVSAGFRTEPPGRAWVTSPGATMGLPNPYGPSDFAESRVPSDLAFTNDLALAVFNTQIPPVLALTNGRYAMSADLGKVYTGFPWRTLRMQPQPTSEADSQLIPDWVLLDMIDFNNGSSPLGSVNPNLGYVSAGDPIVSFGSGLRSQLGVLTNLAAVQRIADPWDPRSSVQQTITNISLLRLAGDQLANVFSNISKPSSAPSWANTGSGSWRERRLEMEFPPDALLLPSELAEINGIANFAPTADQFKLNEYRLAALFPGLSTRSRFFTVYAMGRALQTGQTNNPAATALLQTLVEVDDSTTPPTIRTIQQYLPAD